MPQLNHYRLLGRSGLRVSPLCLGTMTFGTEWGWGADKDECRRMFDLYAERGGNFVDTANRYTEGTSETFVGEFLEGRREQFVLATKFTVFTREGDPNSAGNSRKNMVQSVEASLRRLRTEYIDLYWMHAWDAMTPIEETMRGLDDLVRAGKILYVGVSDTPAWKVSQANTLATLRGWSPFIGLQVRYSLADRDIERELVPMARELGIGITPWGALGAGVLTGKYNAPHSNGEKPRLEVTGAAQGLTERKLHLAAEVQRIAKDDSRSPAQIALAWVLAQPGVTSVILGARNVQQLEDNLACLDFMLSSDLLTHLNEISRIEMGFPHDFLASEGVQKLLTAGAVIEKR
ncbi:MAG TPA: aldo/keto reductase [bacterium]|jgi:aryl-alcohol dehydrogenase-like predicted oxidoreductase